MTAVNTTCAIAGGGPAGVMLGYLLARAGVPVVVLEKHGDFFRDFRGDTIHPSTLQVMHELGLLDAVPQAPASADAQRRRRDRRRTVAVADFSHLPTRCKFIALMPQWDFLDFVCRSRASVFRRSICAWEPTPPDLIEEGGRVVGLRATSDQTGRSKSAPISSSAPTAGIPPCATRAGFAPMNLGAPMDVLWLRVSRQADDPQQTAAARIDRGRVIVKLDRGDYWQCAYLIPKGAYETITRARARRRSAPTSLDIAPFLRDRVARESPIGNEVKLLTVAVDRLPRWYRPGLLCIGDAAHAMSPIGGVGVNLAVQDAVAAANILAAPLRDKSPHGGTIWRAVQTPARACRRG